MTKKQFSEAKQHRCKTRGLRIYLKYLKRARNKKARREGPHIYKTTGAWDVC